MPLGDPNGGEFEYTTEGLPEAIFAVTMPVSDLDRSVLFYTDVLGMTLLGRDGNHAYLSRYGCRMVLELSENAGIDPGVYLMVDSPYNTRRRLMDEGVRFRTDPMKGPLGTFTAFYDPDMNVIRVIEGGAEFKL